MPLGPTECPIWVRNFGLFNFSSLSVIIVCFVCVDVSLSIVNMFALQLVLELLNFYSGLLKTVMA